MRRLGHWALRHLGRYSGPLYLAAILGGCALVLAKTLAVRLTAALVAVPLRFLPDSRREFPEKRGSPMVEEDTGSVAPEGGGLLVAKRKIVTARTRAEQESDVSSGRSDGND